MENYSKRNCDFSREGLFNSSAVDKKAGRQNAVQRKQNAVTIIKKKIERSGRIDLDNVVELIVILSVFDQVTGLML